MNREAEPRHQLVAKEKGNGDDSDRTERSSEDPHSAALGSANQEGKVKPLSASSTRQLEPDQCC